jgi:hypothetical protein
MATTAPKKGKASIAKNREMPDYNKTSFPIRKAGKARALIAKYGPPKADNTKKGKYHLIVNIGTMGQIILIIQ